jgi:hypothetical protein
MIILGLGFRVNRSSPWIISLVVMAWESKYLPLGLGLGILTYGAKFRFMIILFLFYNG